jgi:hypothetical protein
MKLNLRAVVSLGLAALSLVACAGGDKSADTTGNSSASSTGGADGAGSATSSSGTTAPMAQGHITIHTIIESGEQGCGFISQGKVVYVPKEDIVGKPYLFGIYKGGFSPGNDPPLEPFGWGTVPAGLAFDFTSKNRYSKGAYDFINVVYLKTPISKDMMGAAEKAPYPTMGDIAAFDANLTRVLPGDPNPPGGVVRVNITDGDAAVTIQNRIPADATQEAAQKASTDTLFIFP